MFNKTITPFSHHSTRPTQPLPTKPTEKPESLPTDRPTDRPPAHPSRPTNQPPFPSLPLALGDSANGDIIGTIVELLLGWLVGWLRCWLVGWPVGGWSGGWPLRCLGEPMMHLPAGQPTNQPATRKPRSNTEASAGSEGHPRNAAAGTLYFACCVLLEFANIYINMKQQHG